MKKYSYLLVCILLVITGCYSNNSNKSSNEITSSKQMKIDIIINDTVLKATLKNNSSVDAFVELLKDGPLTVTMNDYANMEKLTNLKTNLPENNEYMHTKAGDIVLYQGNTLVIYYDTNSWSLTPLGTIDDIDSKSLKQLLGNNDVTVTFSLTS